MSRKYKWGIIAPGKMAAKFTNGLKLLDNAELHGVGSRDLLRSEQFAGEHGFKKIRKLMSSISHHRIHIIMNILCSV
jgi:predicted dehydrogenase